MVDLVKTLSGLKNAKVSKKGAYLSEGRYALKVKNTVIVQPFSGPEAFVVEFEVIESDNPDHPAGSERSWYQSMQFRDTAFSEMKKFTYAVLKKDLTKPEDQKYIETTIDPQIEPMLQAVIQNNKFAGQTVKCECVLRQSKKKTDPKTGEPTLFTQYNFTPAA